MKNNTICFVGQIDIGENSSKIKMLLAKYLIKFILDGYKYFYVDDRLGFDELSFDTVVKFKRLYNLIKDITLNTKSFSILPLKDGGILWSIIIPYFENDEQ